ncbi:MAG: HEAT repeat domain-containing protein [Fimbriimonadales bacterium]
MKCFAAWLLLAAIAMPTAHAQSYAINREHYSVEYRNLVDSSLRLEFANLLFSGTRGEAVVIQEAKRASGERRRAALISLLYSSDPRFLPVLLPLVDDENRSLIGIASEAVVMHPKEAWPLLLKMARSGSPGAVAQIAHYTHLRRWPLEEFTEHRDPDVRHMAIVCLQSTAHFIEALDDTAWKVRRAAVAGLLSKRGFERKQFVFS